MDWSKSFIVCDYLFPLFIPQYAGSLQRKEKERRVGRKERESLIGRFAHYSKGLFALHLLKKMFRLSVLEFKNITKDFYFIAILLAGVLFLFLDGWFGSPIFGTPSLPLTYYMLEVKDFNYIIFVFIIIIFYTGEVVHRDKSMNYANISDALPIPNWVVYGSKFLSLLLDQYLSCQSCARLRGIESGGQRLFQF